MTTASVSRCVFTYSRTALTWGFASGLASSFSATLQAKSVGLLVRRKKPLSSAFSSAVSSSVIAGLPESRCGSSLAMRSSLGLGLLVAAARGLGILVLALLDRVEVGQDEFGGDDLDVAHGIDRAGDVVDVVVLEAADDLDDGVDFADVGQKLVAEPLARARALDQAGDVDELEDGGDDFWRFGDGGQARPGARRAR